MARVTEPIVWLSLVDVSGPFLAGTVLEEAFPQGLEKVETPRRQRLRAAYDEWQDAIDEDDPQREALHKAWVRMVLEDALEYDSETLSPREKLAGSILYRSPEHSIEYAPDFVVRSAGGKPRLLISVYPPGTNLENPLPEETWLATPAERMTLLCRANECRVGLVTNGEEWMLVNAPIGDTSGYASWFARLWWQESVTLKAFQSLLGVRRCFGPEEDTLSKLLERSLEFQEEITTTLGEQVRRAVEVLIQSLGRADQDRNGELLKDVKPAELYEAGLTVMMRLVFILSAEERNLLLLGDPLYDQHYSVSALRAKLREDADHYGVEVLERRHDAWSRLLATFRGIFGGIEHEALRLPALGGSLFDPDRFPFLEGRASGTKWREEPAVPLPIDNRTVLLLMTALQVLEQRGGAQLLSYRALGVEQIGHVYEGLLEFTAARVPEITLGLLGTKKLPNPQITLSELESLAKKGQETLIEHLNKITGRSVPALRKSLKVEENRERFIRLIQAANGDEKLAKRLVPFGDIIRADSWGNLLVYRQGSFAIVKGTDRRSSGTHYTPRSLTEPIVRYTLEPIVYVGPAEGLPEKDWKLKSSGDILSLKICDMACGSGAFLVEACRYLSQKLVEAWAVEEESGLQLGIDGDARESLGDLEPLPKNLDDRLLIARRLVAQSCLYGVDINHLAVELAKLSIWLVTLAKNKPFSFLDHALRCGDSLIGLHSIEQLRHFSLKPDVDDAVLFKGPLETAVDDAIELRLKLEDMSSNTVDDVHRQEELLAEAEEKIARLRCAADLLVSAEFWGENTADKQERIRQAAVRSAYFLDKVSTEDFERDAAKARQGLRVFHWPLEFPEVIVKRGGFDAFVGNPPFVGGRRMRGNLGDNVLEFMAVQWPHASLNADFCAFFYLRASGLLRESGMFGLLATKTIAQGDTARTGLCYLFANHHLTVVYARRAFTWPGTASVVSALVVAHVGDWKGLRFLDGSPVQSISPILDDEGSWGDSKPLPGNVERSYQGSVLVGLGFVLSEAEATAFLKARKTNEQVIHPYLDGDDLNTHPQQVATRWAIDFRDYSLKQCETTWPEVLARVRKLVKPQRDKTRREAHRKYWWHHGDKRPALYKRIKNMDDVFVIARVTKYVAPIKVPARQVFHDKVYVFDLPCWGAYSCLQSSFHDVWARRGSSTVGETLNYTPSDYFDTFPFLHLALDALDRVGEKYHNYRQKVMVTSQLGITDTYNRFHDFGEVGADIQKLRELQVEMDTSVAAAYGWSDLDLGHGFYETKQGTRFTISESARREVLARLLKLNHERHEKESRQVPQGKAKGSRGRKKQKSDLGDLPLFGKEGA